MSEETRDRAMALIGTAESWQDLMRRLERDGFKDDLSPADEAALRALWQEWCAGQLSDTDLVRELRFWAEGGDFRDHLQGFNAVPPHALVAVAKTRGWLVKSLPSAVLVNPPVGRPIRLRADRLAL